MSRLPSHTTTSRRPWLAAAVAVLCLAVVVSAHGYALRLDVRARDASFPADTRLAYSDTTLRIEPWNHAFEVTNAVAKASVLLETQRVDEAYFLLLPFAATVRGDELFRTAYQDVLEAKWALDSRKAHQQHAREKEDGELDPEDVLK
ncbi:MAG TPA: hypothetical protein VLA05_12750 [Coriobacteriia bacterium]|nr:hypothetical protein [Coriobacteriia bacterium]